MEVVVSLRLRDLVGIGRGEVMGLEDVGDDEEARASVGEALGATVGETTSSSVLRVFGERERDRPRSGSVKIARKPR